MGERKLSCLLILAPAMIEDVTIARPTDWASIVPFLIVIVIVSSFSASSKYTRWVINCTTWIHLWAIYHAKRVLQTLGKMTWCIRVVFTMRFFSLIAALDAKQLLPRASFYSTNQFDSAIVRLTLYRGASPEKIYYFRFLFDPVVQRSWRGKSDRRRNQANNQVLERYVFIIHKNLLENRQIRILTLGS